jgi:hypothetical protein
VDSDQLYVVGAKSRELWKSTRDWGRGHSTFVSPKSLHASGSKFRSIEFRKEDGEQHVQVDQARPIQGWKGAGGKGIVQGSVGHRNTPKYGSREPVKMQRTCQ